MSRPRKGSLPSYRLHKSRGCAVVTIDGRDHYLGPFGTPASKQKYAGLIRAWQQRRGNSDIPPDTPLVPNDRPTVDELVLAYLRHAAAYYKPNHGENKEAGCISDALAVLQRFVDEEGETSDYGSTPAEEFRPKDLKRVREAMVRKGWSRNYVNSQVNRVKRMFAYAAEEDLVPGTVYHALLAVKGLRKGAPGVRETKKVRPVPLSHVKSVLAEAPPVLRAMLLFAYHTGARPGEVCALEPSHLDRSGKVWVYRVPDAANKTDVHEKDRKIFIGPKAQRVLEPWLVGRPVAGHVFSPILAEKLRQEERRAQRKTPLYPSHLKHQAAKKKEYPGRAKRDHYDPISFRRAVKRLCDVAGVPRWTPNRLRHNAATRYRKKYGLEVARILLGHRKMATTEIYADADSRRATQAASEVG